MWSQIDVNDVIGLQQLLDIARQMDQRYQLAQLSDVRTPLLRKQGEAWLYQDGDVEMALLFEYSYPRRHWQVGYVGFLGTITPEDALEKMVECLSGFLTDHSVSSVFVLKPNNMDHPPIQQLHNLVPSHANLKVTVHNTTGEGAVWEIEYVPS